MAVALIVRFDINQSSTQLAWQFLRNGLPIPDPDNAQTGLLSLDQNETVSVTVKAMSDDAELLGISILDCHVMTRPMLYSRRLHPEFAGEFPLPSPFFDISVPTMGMGANTNLGGGAALGDSSAKLWQSAVPLVCLNLGHWDTSFMVTVAIERPTGMDYRVFTFDPETQVGNGAVP